MFNNYSNYYDFFYQDKEYQKETDYIIDLLKKNEVIKGNILEFGSGTGKHGYLLGSKGYNVYGIELSSDMVDKAKTNSNFSCEQGDITKVRLDKSFDVVISLFHVISYQTTNNQIKSVFENAANHLPSGGLFIFDFWYSPAVYHQKPSVRIKRFKNDQISIVRVAEPDNYPNKNLVDVNYNFFVKNLLDNSTNQFKETHKMRHFSIPEIDILSEMSGFERIGAEEFLTKKKPSENTWGVCITLKKK